MSWGALALAVLAVWSFAADWAMVSKSGSIDYRNRVTGLRLLADGEDPYHYKWTLGKPERFFDPFENPALPITKTTVTPASPPTLVKAPRPMICAPSFFAISAAASRRP